MRSIIGTAEAEVQSFIKRRGLQNIVHPKHKGNPQKNGAGVICTAVPILLSKNGDFLSSIKYLRGVLDHNLEVLKNNYVNPLAQ